MPFPIVEMLSEEKAIVRLADLRERSTWKTSTIRGSATSLLHGKVALTKIAPDLTRAMLAEIGASSLPKMGGDFSAL